nr:glutamate-gated chloride channel-like [Onthophagus taurus]
MQLKSSFLIVSSRALVTLMVVLLLIASSPRGRASASLLKQKKAILNNLLNPDRYDGQIKPGILNEEDSPTTVQVSMHILSITNVDDKNMMFSLEFYVRQKWKDERLEFNNTANNIKYIVLNEIRQIWMPDLFFTNEHSSRTHDLMESNSFRKIYRDGTVLTSARVSLVLRCKMFFALYPMDSQVCPLTIESYRYKADDISLEWTNESTPVTLGDDMLIPLFTVERFWTDRGLIAMESGEYSRLTLYFKFARRTGYYLVQVYIPCGMAFIVSCFPFWLNPKLITARVLIGIGVLLSTSLQVSYVNSNMPKVPYTKAIDIFTGMTLTFIFCALLETIFVHVTEVKSTRKLETQESVAKDDVEQVEKFDKPNAIIKMKAWMFDDHETLNDIDAASRALFPMSYILFLFIYSLTCVSLIME